mgnify:CR=1 FL=1
MVYVRWLVDDEACIVFSLGFNFLIYNASVIKRLVYISMFDIMDWKQAAKLDPSDSRSLYNIATFYYQSKDYSNAEQFTQRALKIEPGNRDYQYLLALIFKEQGRTDLSNQIMQSLQ